MLESVISGRNSGLPEWLKSRRLAGPAARTLSAALLAPILSASLCVFPCVAQAQSAAESINAYADAIKQSTIAERIVAMERYLALSSGGSLKEDALEFLAWDHMRVGHSSQSAQRARELMAVSPANPIAVAVLSRNPSAPQGKSAVQERLATLKAAMGGLDRLNKPEGMLARNFQMMRQQVAIMLTGATGLGYLEIEDYPQARLALQQAVASDPNNAQWVYGLGLALLNGKNRDQYRGYWYLARAANLTEGTPQGGQIADYARRTYHNDGGKEAGWQRFTASAAALDAPPNPESSSAGPSSGVSSAGSTPAGLTPAKTAASAAGSPNEAKRSASNAASTKMKSSAGSSGNTKASIGFEDTLREPASPGPARPPAASADRPKPLAAPLEAVSLAIMIETSLLTTQNRGAIIATLKEIVRNLRSNDEACILVFSDQLDFEQDLTADDQLLEDAISQIRPKQAKALLSGIAFAAGHLKRIGKNSNRVLLVISDGRTSQAGSDTLLFRSQVSGVRIDCIGLKADGASERALLERVAAYSGGKAAFASGPGEFRTAALEMTRGMGIAVP